MRIRRILSIDGGGIRGLIPAHLLAAAEKRLGSPLHQIFDLIVGSSTGGIIAIGAGLKLPMTEVHGLYRDAGRQIFRRECFRWGLFRPKYSSHGLERALERSFGARRFSACLTRVMVTTVRVQDHRSAFRKSWEPNYLTAVEAALQTSAAPTYFEPRPGGLIDGGVAANNPSVCALAEATRIFGPVEMRLLSLGCGAPIPHAVLEPTIPPAGWGLLGWAARIPGDLIDAGMETADYQCRHLMTAGDYLRVQPSMAVPIEMDDASARAIDELGRIAETSTKKVLAEVCAFLA